MSIELTQTVLALHAVWSICVPIAVVETFVPDRRTSPWLSRRGLVTVAMLYVLGAVLVFWGNYTEEHFIASPAQLFGIGAVIIGLVILAFAIRKYQLPMVKGQAPSPLLTGIAATALTSVYWGPAVLVTSDGYEWVGVVVWSLVAVIGVVMVSRWSRQRGWDDRHRFALAAGAASTYIWVAFPLQPEKDSPLAADLLSNTLFGATAVLVLILAGRVAARRRLQQIHSNECGDHQDRKAHKAVIAKD